MPQTTGQIMVISKIEMDYIRLPEELRPARKFFGPNPNHTAGLGIVWEGKQYYIPLDADEIKGLLEGLEKVIQQPLQEPRLVIASTEMPKESNGKNL